MRSWVLPASIAGLLAAAGVAAITYGTGDGPRPAAAQPSAPAEPPADRRITVEATGTVSGQPDVLTIQMGVQVQAGSATDALRQSSERASALIASLREAGVAQSDLSTADVSVWPRYDHRNESSTIIGYEATNTVTAKLRDLSKAGSVIDTAAGAVGDAVRIGGLSFSIENTGPLYKQAREQAIERAREQAGQLAAAAGVELGRVLTIDESAQDVPPPVPFAGDGAGAEAAVPIEPGTQSLRLTVRVVFEIPG
jgi:uncharacterized protein